MRHCVLSFFMVACFSIVAVTGLSAKTMVEKTYTGQEILDNWIVYDANNEAVLNWELSGSMAIAHVCGTNPKEIVLKSKLPYYDVASIAITSTSTARTFWLHTTHVGDTYGDGVNMTEYADEKSGGGILTATKPTGTTPAGYIYISGTFNNNSAATFEISSITVTYDADGGKRDLKWSAEEATAIIGTDFNAPVLTGNNLNGVTYSSSNIRVADIAADGTITIGLTGEATITASAPAMGVWDACTVSYKLTVKHPANYVSETVTIATPGSLQEVLVDLDTRPNHLNIKGTLNSTDLKYIISGQGKMAAVSSLDLSDVSFDYDDGQYNSVSGSDGSGVGLGTTTRIFYLSATCHTEYESSPNGLGGGNGYYYIHTNNLAGLFYNNQGIQEVILPKNMDGIGTSIFANSAVQSVTFPASITAISDSAFYKTPNLLYLELPSSVKTIGSHAFRNSGIKVLVSNGLKEIGGSAFQSSQIESIDLSAVETLGNSAFNGAKHLGSANLASLKTKVPDNCFYETALTEVKLPEGITTIERYAFNNCSNLKQVELPTTLTHIYGYAFGNTGIESLSVPAALQYVGRSAFSGTPYYNNMPDEGGVCYIGKVAYCIGRNVQSIESITIKDGTVALSPGFIEYGSRKGASLKSVSLPSSVVLIGEDEYSPDDSYAASFYCYVFYQCENLETINLPKGVKRIGREAFAGCKKLVIEALPEDIEYIGNGAFSTCEELYTITLSKNLQFVGSNAFANCSKLSHVKLYSPKLTGGANAFGRSGIEKLTVGSQVETIPASLCYGCTNLIKVVFEGENETALPLVFGEKCFFNCTSLKIEQLPMRTVEVGEQAFYGVEFGSNFSTGNITSIGENAFNRAKGIQNLEIGDKLQACDAYAFSDITSLQSIYYNASNLNFEVSGNKKIFLDDTSLNAITIGQDVEYVPEYLFAYLSNVKKLTFEPRTGNTRAAGKSLLIDTKAFTGCGMDSLILPDVRTAIGEEAFDGCRSLTYLRMGNGTESIYKRAFYECNALQQVDVPQAVNFIGERALYPIQTLYFHTTTPPTLGDNAIQNYATVYIPATGEAEYRNSLNSGCTIKTYSVSAFNLDKSEMQMAEGENRQITASIQPAEFEGLDIAWTSSDASVATVDNFGHVTGLKSGVAIITASIAYIDGFTASCKVIVGDGTAVEGVVADATDRSLEIYNLSGMKVADNMNGLPSGIYVVRQGTKSWKTVVK